MGGRTFTRHEMAGRLERPDVDAYIVEADGEAVGYPQAWFGESADVGGLGMFLVPTARGRRIGPDAAGMLARYLLSDGGRERLTVDPYLWNERAVERVAEGRLPSNGEREPDREHVHRWLLMAVDARHRTQNP
jgi:RimJ/RimL family protein N-acetyltransferase